jgi:hypothetical protein
VLTRVAQDHKLQETAITPFLMACENSRGDDLGQQGNFVSPRTRRSCGWREMLRRKWW